MRLRVVFVFPTDPKSVTPARLKGLAGVLFTVRSAALPRVLGEAQACAKGHGSYPEISIYGYRTTLPSP